MRRVAVEPPLFDDRRDAGRRLARELARLRDDHPIVYGLARGGVAVAAEVARALGAPLDALAVRKVGHPQQPELALGAVAAGGPVVLHELGWLDEGARHDLVARAEAAAADARAMDERLHAGVERLEPGGAVCLLVDDGLATGATMLAACRWARARGAARVVAAVPVAARETAELLRTEADEVVCPNVVDGLWAVGVWYGDFGQTTEDEVRDLLRAGRPAAA
jgi:putative phosphoribosyl transferase